MSRRKASAVEAPATREAAALIADLYATFSADIAAIEAERAQRRAAIDQDCDERIARRDDELKPLFEQLKAWWATASATERRKSIELGAVELGNRKTPAKLKVKGKVEAAIAWLRIPRRDMGALAKLARPKYSLDRKAIAAAVLSGNFPLLDEWFAVTSREEFFVAPIAEKDVVIAAVENAIIARLKAASEAGVLGYKFRTLETYPDDWTEYLKDKGPINAPAGWVTFAGLQKPDETSSEDRHPAMFGLVVMAENARNETATRHGGPNQDAEPGSYQLVEDAAGLLRRQTLGLDIQPISIGALRFVRAGVMKERKVSMLALELGTTLVLDGPEFPADEVGDFTDFHVDWDIAPFGGIDSDPAEGGVQLPDDQHADAVDHVQLEGAQ